MQSDGQGLYAISSDGALPRANIGPLHRQYLGISRNRDFHRVERSSQNGQIKRQIITQTAFTNEETDFSITQN